MMYLVQPVPTVCRAEDANLDVVAGCQLLKPGPVPSPLCSARFHQNPSFISLILTVISLIQHITPIVVITGSDKVV